MQNNFDQCFNWLLEDEGGYCNDPGDPGGMTNLGVTHIDWAAWIGHEPTEAEMRAITKADVKPLYKAKYWDKLRCDDLPSGVDYAVFDYGVNSGIGRGARVLQRLVNVPADGAIGPITLAATQKADAETLIDAVCDEREAFLHGLATFRIFGKGWLSRVERVRKRAKGLR